MQTFPSCNNNSSRISSYGSRYYYNIFFIIDFLNFLNSVYFNTDHGDNRLSSATMRSTSPSATSLNSSSLTPSSQVLTPGAKAGIAIGAIAAAAMWIALGIWFGGRRSRKDASGESKTRSHYRSRKGGSGESKTRSHHRLRDQVSPPVYRSYNYVMYRY